jgi:hypothetical protein
MNLNDLANIGQVIGRHLPYQRGVADSAEHERGASCDRAI